MAAAPQISSTVTALTSIAAATASIGSAINSLLLVSPQYTIGYQPQQPNNKDSTVKAGGPALLFHYEGEQSATLTSDITDHYTEDNISVQDQIALKPVTISTHGFIGELNNVVPPLLAPLSIAADKLGAISAYAPALSVSAQNAYNQAFFAYQTANAAINAVTSAISSISGTGGESVIDGTSVTIAKNQTKQQIYFQQFYGYWTQRTLFTIQTPWAVFQNMAIQTLRAVQDEETTQISDFEVTFKQIRVVSSITLANQALQGQLKAQAAAITNNGTQTIPNGG